MKPTKILILDSESESEWNTDNENEQILIEVTLQAKVDDKLRNTSGYAIAIVSIPLLYESRKTIFNETSNRKIST